MEINITRLDHFVLTVRNIQASLDFYCGILGMQEITFKENRKAILFGQQKINLHEVGSEFTPHAHSPTPGSADFCLITQTPIDQVIELLSKKKIPLVEGPVDRTGALGKIRSIYVRDPDENLVELSNYAP